MSFIRRAAAKGIFSPRSPGTTLRPAWLGPEMVINGQFDTDLSGWSVATSTAPGTMEWSDGAAVLVNPGGGAARLTQGVPTVVGRRYRFTYSGNMTVRLGTAEGGAQVKALDAVGRQDAGGPFVFTATSTTTWIGTVDSTAGRMVDNFSIRQVR